MPRRDSGRHRQTDLIFWRGTRKPHIALIPSFKKDTECRDEVHEEYELRPAQAFPDIFRHLVANRPLPSTIVTLFPLGVDQERIHLDIFHDFSPVLFLVTGDHKPTILARRRCPLYNHEQDMNKIRPSAAAPLSWFKMAGAHLHERTNLRPLPHVSWSKRTGRIHLHEETGDEAGKSCPRRYRDEVETRVAAKRSADGNIRRGLIG